MLPLLFLVLDGESEFTHVFHLSVYFLRIIVDLITALGMQALTYKVSLKRVQISSSQGGGSTNPGSSTNPAHLFGDSSKLAGTPVGKRENQSTMDIK